MKVYIIVSIYIYIYILIIKCNYYIKKDDVHGKQGKIRVYKNQDLVQDIYEDDDENRLMMNSVVTLHLQKGDEVKLWNGYDKPIEVHSYLPLTFTGYKI